MPEHRYIETNIDKKNDSANNLLVPRRSAPGIASVPQIRPMQNRACDGASPDSGPQATRTERTENGAFSSVLAANWHWGRTGRRTAVRRIQIVSRPKYENNRLDRRERIRRLGHSEGSVVPGPASDGYRAPTGKHRTAEPESRNADGRRSRPDDPEGSRPQPRRGNQRLQPGPEQSRHLRTDAERLSAHRRGSQAGRHKTAAGRRRSRQPVRRARHEAARQRPYPGAPAAGRQSAGRSLRNGAQTRERVWIGCSFPRQRSSSRASGPENSESGKTS